MSEGSMSKGLHLTVTTPMKVLLDMDAVSSIRAEDESGSFGILPGHTDFLTALPASVIMWRDQAGQQGFCAIRAGLMTVTEGAHVAVACREGVLGSDLQGLRADIQQTRGDEAEADRRARVEQMRLHTTAVRQLMRFLQPQTSSAFDHPPAIAQSLEGKDK